uniref:ATP synthase F0 subunit 8 n=1 Tax=Allacta bimaculata TaxID=2093428 RepID=UPI0027A31491|nr:ATP synthase F0 subunit 8 [Allacta bimaculata]WGO57018.1 ATP synthase F0 subunit 8 [Allacta bimaculata]
MPQMMPISWLMLFMFFSMNFMMINMINYYIYMPKKNFKKHKYNNLHSLNWKW